MSKEGRRLLHEEDEATTALVSLYSEALSKGITAPTRWRLRWEMNVVREERCVREVNHEV